MARSTFSSLIIFWTTVLLIATPAVAEPVLSVPVAMTDGTRLLTDYELPPGEGPFPIILMRTPYNRVFWFSGLTPESAQTEGWLSLGFGLVVQNTRGAWGSESEDGRRRPFHNEGWTDDPDNHMHRDGVDCMAWVRAQPWCNGTVLTYGGSAPGITSQLLAGASQDIAGQIMKVSGANFYHQLGREGGVVRREQMNWYIIEFSTHIVDEIEAHPYYDDYWRAFNACAPERVAQITAPGLHIGGWFDTFAEGTIDSFQHRQAVGGPGAAGNQKLIMAPLSHLGTLGFGIQYPVGEFPEQVAYENAFLEYWGKGVENGYTELPNVTYFLMGAVDEPGAPGNVWRTATQWPPAESTTMSWYLHADGGLRRDAPMAKAQDRRSFMFDPSDPCPTVGGRTLFPQNAFDITQSTWFPGPQDQRSVSNRADVLKFTSAVLKHPLEVTGEVTVKLYVSTNVPDTDFTAKLVDVYPDGREMLILDSIQRVKLRNGFEAPDPLPRGAVGEVNVAIGNTSNVFNAGHRVGVHVSSSNFPRFDVNPNNGDDLEGVNPSRVATNTVYMGIAYASALVITTPDSDREGVADYDEQRYGTDPNVADTDRDGLTDLVELESHRDPLLPEDGAASFLLETTDGAALDTYYALPTGVPPFPVMVCRTPNGRAGQMAEAQRWRNLGYAVVVQELRGTGSNEAAATAPFETDGWGPVRDAETLATWIHGQAWCNGRIGSYGVGAEGAAAVLAAGATQLLSAQAIENAPATFYGQFAYQGGVLRGEAAQAWDITGAWRATPTYTTFWQHHDAVDRAAFISAPGLHIGGWFDAFSQGTLDGFTSRQYRGDEGARGHQFLVLEPASHTCGSGELAFPDAAPMPDRAASRRTFFAHYLRGSEATLPAPVKYYLMGANGETDAPGNEWRVAEDWPPYPIAHRRFYLAPDATLSTAPPTADAVLTYHYDPLDPVLTHGGANVGALNGVPPGPADQRFVNGHLPERVPGSPRNDVLKYATAPLAEPVEIVGPVRVRLYVSATAEDTDFTAKLVDIYPDGREMLFVDNIQRVQFRNGYVTPEPLAPGTVGEIEIDLWSTALVVNAGHRIGVQVSSSNVPRFEAHPLASDNSIHTGAATPSALLIPVEAALDIDADGLDEAGEANAGTDPHNADTDDDGCSDATEVIGRSDPLDPLSLPAACGGPDYVYLETETSGQGRIEIVNPEKSATRVLRNTPLVLTAVPEEGWKFDAWLGDIEGAGLDNPLTVMMDTDRTIAAQFSAVGGEGEGEGEGEEPCAWCCNSQRQGPIPHAADGALFVIAFATLVALNRKRPSHA